MNNANEELETAITEALRSVGSRVDHAKSLRDAAGAAEDAVSVELSQLRNRVLAAYEDATKAPRDIRSLEVRKADADREETMRAINARYLQAVERDKAFFDQLLARINKGFPDE